MSKPSSPASRRPRAGRSACEAVLTLSAVVVLLALASTACCSKRRGDTPPEVGGPPSLAAPRDVITPLPAPEAGALSAPAVLALRPYTDVPAIAEGVRRFDAGDHAGCAAVLQQYLATEPQTPIRPQATYLLGVCRHFEGKHEVAAGLLRGLVPSYPLLADYARYFAAASLAALDRPDQAVPLLRDIPDDSSQSRRASELLVQLLVEKRDSGAARELGRFLARFPDAPARSHLQLVQLLAAAGRNADAIDAAWNLWAALPASAEAGKVPETVRPLVQRLPRDQRDGRDVPGEARWLRRGRVLFNAHRSEEAVKALEEVAKRALVGSADWCEAEHLIARSWDKLRKRKPAVPHYDAAIEHCAHDPVLVDLLFFGGKSAHQEGLYDRALTLFARLHREFPEHSYNDDALLREADIHRTRKAPDEARAALERALATYPDGDMREEAAWGLLWAAYDARDFKEAVRRANQVLALVPHETHYRSAGRTLYWKGRSLEQLGESEAATESYRACLESYPLTWYSGLAYTRLHGLDPEAAPTLLRDIAARDTAPPGPLEDERPLAVTEHVAFRRGLELLRLGLPAPAGRELVRLPRRAGADDAATDWLLAEMYARSGDSVRSHDIARRKRPEFAAHYPKEASLRYWQLAYPRPYRSVVADVSAPGVPEALVHAIMREESGFSAGIESWANAVGLMQLLVPTAKGLAKKGEGPIDRTALTDPRLNVTLGTRYLAELLGRFGNLPPLAAAGYNAGAHRIRTWLAARGDRPLDEFVELIPFEQTRDYTKRVIESVHRYRYLYGPEPGTLAPLRLELPR